MTRRISLFTVLVGILHLGLAGFAQAAPVAPIHISGEGAKSVFALVVGISTYKNGKSPYAEGSYSLINLNWAANDALKFSQYLQSQGIPEANVRLLTNENATKRAFEDGFQWLLDQQKHASLLVFYYSGHGATNIPDTDGDEARRNPGDKFDEALVPYDNVDLFQFSAKEIAKNPELEKSWIASLFIDDELNSYLSAMKTPCALILDSCFSGGAVRGVTADVAGLEIRKKSLQMPKDPSDPIGSALMKAILGPDYFEYWKMALTPNLAAETASKEPEASNSVKMDLPGNITALMACLENQTSAEVTGGTIDGGAFTYCLLNALNDPGKSDTNHDGWVDLKEAFSAAMDNMMTDSTMKQYCDGQQPDIDNSKLAATLDLTPDN